VSPAPDPDARPVAAPPAARGLTLRARLLLTFLLFALIPTALFGAFTIEQLGRAVARWYRPGVDRSLESALEVTRASVARLESASLVHAGDVAASLGAKPVDDAERARLRASLHATGLDFLQLYRLESGRWTRAEHVVPEGVLPASVPDLSAELATPAGDSHVLRSPQGVLAGVARTADGRLVVAGLWVAPDFFQRVDDVGRGMAYYRQLGFTVGLHRNSVLLLVAVVALLLLLSATLLSTVLARQMARPLQGLSAAFGRVAHGDLDTRVAPVGASEMRSLGESFNVMTERLRDARDAVQRAEREAVWRDVAQKLAHEFRNLLTPMKLSLQMIETKLDSAPEPHRSAMAQSLRAALDEVASLERLAGQFSQYARLPEPRLEALDARELVDAAVAGLPSSHVDVQSASREPMNGDRVLLTRAVHNLLLNAVEASPEGAAVEVRIDDGPDQVRIQVLDRGSGLPKSLERRLFEPYVSSKRRGSGLGLSLVRDIVTQHGGTVTLTDRPGGGACATLLLPRSGVAVEGASNTHGEAR
jgi:nitrogen fixation/metabolism regulation signal transduction histidine kinase